MSVKALIEEFVRAFNGPESDVFPLYGDTVDWIELPSGRRGGRDELFAALRQSRSFLTGLHLDILSITVDGDDAVLESAWSGRTVQDGKELRARVIWFFTVQDGKLVKEHDYSIVLNP